MSYQHMGFWDKVGLKKEKEKAKQDYDEPLESSIAPTMTSATCLSRLHLLSPESRAWGKQCCWYHFSIDWCVDYTFLWRRMALTFVLNRKKKINNNWAQSRSIVQPSREMYSRVDTQGRSFFICEPLRCCNSKLHTNELSWNDWRCGVHLIMEYCGEQNALLVRCIR